MSMEARLRKLAVLSTLLDYVTAITYALYLQELFLNPQLPHVIAAALLLLYQASSLFTYLFRKIEHVFAKLKLDLVVLGVLLVYHFLYLREAYLYTVPLLVFMPMWLRYSASRLLGAVTCASLFCISSILDVVFLNRLWAVWSAVAGFATLVNMYCKRFLLLYPDKLALALVLLILVLGLAPLVLMMGIPEYATAALLVGLKCMCVAVPRLGLYPCDRYSVDYSGILR